ncbi:MAG: PP2C family serine/threonine-protein phosphatase [Jatrophihabitantaceae bacterium]
MALILRYAVRSDLGLVRGNNEDSVYAGPRLLAIADGMGGHAAGEVASKIVISTLENLDEDRSLGDLMAALRDSVAEANQRIEDAVQRKPELEGMGTTLTALRFVGTSVGLVHVGDSRAYLLRGDGLSQITHDDTYVQFLVDSGKLTPEEAKDHPRKSVILKALRGAQVDPDISIREARPGDRYLLCTDGLSDVISTETILETMRILDPQECADRLVELALRGGGPDNVTVIVADAVNAKVGDIVDDVPVIAGAFVDPSAADIPGTDSPAERAAHISRPYLRTSVVVAEPARRSLWRRSRRWLIALGAIIVVVAGLGLLYASTQSRYFVGKDGSEVAIFRGVNQSFGPLKFYEVSESVDLKLADLNQTTRVQVTSGINANSKVDAERIVQTLQQPDNMLPICRPPATLTPTPTPTKTSTGKSTPTRSRAHPSASPSPSTAAASTPPITSPSPSPSDNCRTTG